MGPYFSSCIFLAVLLYSADSQTTRRTTARTTLRTTTRSTIRLTTRTLLRTTTEALTSTTTPILSTTQSQQNSSYSSTTSNAPFLCSDSGIISCDFPKRYCYESVSAAYGSLCCGTCQSLANSSLGTECFYGDLSTDCDAKVTPGMGCTNETKMECCEACQSALRYTTTTTQDTCVDQLENNACDSLVANVSWNCYLLETQCCKTCRPFIEYWRPATCKYGNRISNCRPGLCSFLEDSCCATCADLNATTTTTTPIPTTSACYDVEPNCPQTYGLIRTPSRCYNEDIRTKCCGSCLSLADSQKANCSWGDKDLICSLSSSLNCASPSIRNLCCSRCPTNTDSTSTTTPDITTTAFIPSNCSDRLPQCRALTAVASNCYQDLSSFVANSCCASCYIKVRPDLPSNCSYGDRLSYCSLIADLTSCQNDNTMQRDCCGTCQERLRTTTAAPTTSCYNVYSDFTCVLLYTQLGGNCSMIRDKCCKTCMSTRTTIAHSQAITTVDPCKDILPPALCQVIIAKEGLGDCYMGYLSTQCCASCRTALILSSTVIPIASTTQLSVSAAISTSSSLTLGESQTATSHPTQRNTTEISARATTGTAPQKFTT